MSSAMSPYSALMLVSRTAAAPLTSHDGLLLKGQRFSFAFFFFTQFRTHEMV